MPTLIHPSGSRTVEVLPMTVREARQTGFLPQVYVPVEKDAQGFSRQLDDSDLLEGEYTLLPRNRAG